MKSNNLRSYSRGPTKGRDLDPEPPRANITESISRRWADLIERARDNPWSTYSKGPTGIILSGPHLMSIHNHSNRGLRVRLLIGQPLIRLLGDLPEFRIITGFRGPGVSGCSPFHSLVSACNVSLVSAVSLEAGDRTRDKKTLKITTTSRSRIEALRCAGVRRTPASVSSRRSANAGPERHKVEVLNVSPIPGGFSGTIDRGVSVPTSRTFAECQRSRSPGRCQIRLLKW